MNFVKTLVVYDSNYGNTQMIANVIAKNLKGKAIYIADYSKDDLEGVELLIVGSPINGWRPTVKISEFLSDLSTAGLQGVKAAAFDTRVKLFIHGDAASRISQSLEKAGGKIISKPKGFVVEGTDGPLKEGEVDKAIEWARELKEEFSSSK